MSIHPLLPVLIEQSTSLTLEEFCHALQTQESIIIEMVEYELLQPQGNTPEQWRFDSSSLRRGRIATSFQRDLEVNMPGIALALELMDRIEDLQCRLEILQKVNQYD